MQNNQIAGELARLFKDRADALGYKKKQRDNNCLDFFAGAACAANLLGREDLGKHLGLIMVMVLSVRGYIGINEIAAGRE